MIVAAFVSFFSFYFLLSHLSPTARRRMVGYKGPIDVMLHGSVIWLFLGTSTMGLLQAEAAAICFSIYLRGYSYLYGYERYISGSWQRFAGRLT